MTDLIEALSCLVNSLEALSQPSQIEPSKSKSSKRTIANKSKLIVRGNGWQLMSIGSQTELWHYQKSPYGPGLLAWRPHILDWQIVRELLEIAAEEGYQQKVESVMRSEAFIRAIAFQFDRTKDLSLTVFGKKFHIWDKPKPNIKVVQLIKK